MEVAELKHNQEMILVRLAAMEQFLRDGREQQLNGARLSPALPGNTKDQPCSGKESFNFDDLPGDDFGDLYEP